MSDEFRKNLMGPEPTLLPAETEVYQHLALGQEALDLVGLPDYRLLRLRLRQGEMRHGLDALRHDPCTGGAPQP